ncbi:hypothetical protein EN912_32080 [Mesorhizobium sp. M7A.F.Ca.CA.004.02.1.1]|nr:hypothetical protein EN912_32080 [Mesorhizobium sp. M7A.F.Ca.CA.004.02.1.1]
MTDIPCPRLRESKHYATSQSIGEGSRRRRPRFVEASAIATVGDRRCAQIATRPSNWHSDGQRDLELIP